MNKLQAVALSCLMIDGHSARGLSQRKFRHSAGREHDRFVGSVLHRHHRPRFQNLAADARPEESQLSAGDGAARRNASRQAAPTEISSSGRRIPPPPELAAQEGVPTGKVYSFTMSSNDSTVFNPGMIRDDPDGCLNASVFAAQTAPGDKSNLLVPTAHAGIWTRSVDVYVPSDYVAGSEAPFIVLGDSGYPNEKQFFTDPRQSHPAASRAADGRSQHRRGRPGRARERARARVRCRLWSLCGVRRERSASSGREPSEREAHQESRRPRDHGHQLERSGGLHDGLVSSRALSPGAHLFADRGEPAMAA